MHDIQLIIRACDFAARRHAGQHRKDAAKTPYINHPIEVARILCDVGEVADAEVLAAALLHDTVEDTPTTLEELRNTFGARVAELVAECTDDRSKPKAERKRLQVVNAPHKSGAAKRIKLADKIANVRDLANADGWKQELKREYVDWAVEVVAGLRGQCVSLDRAFDEAVAQARAALT